MKIMQQHTLSSLLRFASIAGGLILSLTGSLTAYAANTAASAGDVSETPPAYAVTAVSEDTPLRILTATDLHYISPALTDNGEMFQKIINAADGKVMTYIEELTDAFIAEVLAQKPEILILSGDLTFNGAYKSHEDLSDKLSVIAEAGIQVLVIPGNHDIENSSAASFEKDAYTKVPSATAEQFYDLYQAYGYEQAMTRDTDSFSYIYEAGSHLWILMLDSNAVHINAVSETTLSWIEAQLKAAQNAGAQVLAVSHQTVLTHNQLFTYGFQITNADQVSELYQAYDVLCNLCGHMHMQHIAAEENSTAEIVTSALSVNPCQYGELTYDGTTLTYSSRRTDVSAWAKNRQSENEDLLHFDRYAETFFKNTSRRQIQESFADSTLDTEEIQLLADTFADINAAYFAGDPVHESDVSEGLSAWKAQGASLTTAYLDSVLAEADKDQHHITVSIGK